MIVSTKAIILRVIKHGESSKILELFTDDYGRISVIAKGARSNKSKFAGILEPATVIDCSFYMKTNRDIYLLNTAEIVINTQKIQGELERIGAALAICEALLDTQPTHFKNENLFVNASLSMQFITDKNANSYSVLSKFMTDLCEECGFELNFDESHGDFKCYFLLDEGASQQLKPLNQAHCVISAKANLIGHTFLNLDLINSAVYETERNICLEFVGMLIAYLERHIGKKINIRALSLI